MADLVSQCSIKDIIVNPDLIRTIDYYNDLLLQKPNEDTLEYVQNRKELNKNLNKIYIIFSIILSSLLLVATHGIAANGVHGLVKNIRKQKDIIIDKAKIFIYVKDELIDVKSEVLLIKKAKDEDSNSITVKNIINSFEMFLIKVLEYDITIEIYRLYLVNLQKYADKNPEDSILNNLLKTSKKLLNKIFNTILRNIFLFKVPLSLFERDSWVAQDTDIEILFKDRQNYNINTGIINNLVNAWDKFKSVFKKKVGMSENIETTIKKEKNKILFNILINFEKNDDKIYNDLTLLNNTIINLLIIYGTNIEIQCTDDQSNNFYGIFSEIVNNLLQDLTAEEINYERRLLEQKKFLEENIKIYMQNKKKSLSKDYFDCFKFRDECLKKNLGRESQFQLQCIDEFQTCYSQNKTQNDIILDEFEPPGDTRDYFRNCRDQFITKKPSGMEEQGNSPLDCLKRSYIKNCSNKYEDRPREYNACVKSLNFSNIVEKLGNAPNGDGIPNVMRRCQKCQSVMKNIKSGHPQIHYCDICNCDIEKQTSFYRCKSCDFDYCNECYNRQEKKNCPPIQQTGRGLYNYIYDPIKNRKYNINSKYGKTLIKKYIR
uniref:ZZ-type domain-containing protein n=1 Tax=viral metagenome TaxID=1070528 RepID=A0A6C0IY30_9ZZZZ